MSELKTNVSDYKKVNDDEIHVKVSSNLLDRHSQLYWLEQLTRKHLVHKALVVEHDEAKKTDQDSRRSHFSYGPQQAHQDSKGKKLLPEERVYHLAVTDLFVEKAQAFLEERADSYRRSGKMARRLSSTIILIGAVLAWQQMISQHGDSPPSSWLALASSFARAFTAYGMIVLAAVGFWRYSKSMLDQAERLFERRHALRQGRLFVHLNDGKLTIDEMEKAFRWNVSQENAFANINTEAAAPWGAVAKEMAKGFPEVFKAGMQSVGKGKSEEK